MGVSAVRFVVRATITRSDIPALCACLADLLRGRPGDVVMCDVAGIHRPDVVTVEALARLRLTARRHGRRLVVTGAAPGLLLLFGLLGLTDLLDLAGPATDESEQAAGGSGQAAGGSGQVGRRQVGREPEQREQAGGVQEVVDGRDPPV
ncbi:STAS domain-containing protein [Actinoplanes sp. NPDC023801]|uniref:STAS domain-containing protein n=1 Tax=Actinoplanes sp. NPDC023801 TaxID=3154595 RepID=UPI00340563C1